MTTSRCSRPLIALLKADGFNVAKFSHPAAFLANRGAGAVPGRDPRRLDAGHEWIGSAGSALPKIRRRRASSSSAAATIPPCARPPCEAGAFGFLSKPFDDDVCSSSCAGCRGHRHPSNSEPVRTRSTIFFGPGRKPAEPLFSREPPVHDSAYGHRRSPLRHHHREDARAPRGF